MYFIHKVSSIYNYIKNVALRQFATKLLLKKVSELKYFCSEQFGIRRLSLRVPKTNRKIRYKPDNKVSSSLGIEMTEITAPSAEDDRLFRTLDERNVSMPLSFRDQLEVVDIEELL